MRAPFQHIALSGLSTTIVATIDKENIKDTVIQITCNFLPKCVVFFSCMRNRKTKRK